MPPVPADPVALPPLRVPLLVAFLCLTVEPAARGATVLLGERLEAPTLVALAAGPGILLFFVVCLFFCPDPQDSTERYAPYPRPMAAHTEQWNPGGASEPAAAHLLQDGVTEEQRRRESPGGGGGTGGSRVHPQEESQEPNDENRLCLDYRPPHRYNQLLPG